MTKHPQSRGYHAHGGTQATTAAKHPPRPTQQSIRSQGGITCTAEPKRQRRQSIREDQHSRATAGRGQHAHGGAQAMTAATPDIRTRQSKARKTEAHVGTTQVATPARADDGWWPTTKPPRRI